MCRFLRFGLRGFQSHEVRDTGHGDVEVEIEKEVLCGFVVGDCGIMKGKGRNQRIERRDWSNCGIVL